MVTILPLGRGVFLNDNGVSSCRHRGTGKNTYGLARFQLALERMAGGRGADDCELRGGVFGTHRVTIHGGGIERRLIAFGA